MNSTKRICLWSGPRNISTATMYSFAQRPDTEVVDEPLYAHYLANTEAKEYHPGAIEILANMENDGEKVIERIVLGKYKMPVVFFKMMTHHLLNLDLGFLAETINIILIRDPHEMLPSVIHQIEKPVLEDAGYRQSAVLYDHLVSIGQNPIVIDAKRTLLNPKKVLPKVCEESGIPFYKEMLSWKAGPLKQDGIWAKDWYHNVHKSTEIGRAHV